MEPYGSCNYSFFSFRKVTETHGLRTILPFDFQHVTEFHRLRNNASFWFSACYGISRIAQQRMPSISKRSTKGCMPSNKGTRTKLGYDTRLLEIPRTVDCLGTGRRHGMWPNQYKSCVCLLLPYTLYFSFVYFLFPLYFFLSYCFCSDVNLSRSGSFDTGYGDLDDATSSEGR